MIRSQNPFTVYVEDFEKEAEEFLRKYGCGKAIEEPHPIPVFEIATKLMSLEVVSTECLSLDGSVQGAITFTKGVVDVFDWENGDYIGYSTEGPTILIDSDITNIGRYNNTIAHECYHWWKHRNYFNYNRTHGHSVEFGIRCEKTMPRENIEPGKWTDIERMEYQARTVAPKILMPRKATTKKIEELYDELRTGRDSSDRYEVAGSVVDKLSQFFHVSRQSAAIRMLELGFAEAEMYCGDEIAPNRNYHERKRTNAYIHHKPISEEAAFDLYLSNDFLRATIDTGAFCFADGYFVLKDDKYVLYSFDEGYSLTDYAKCNLHECTLDFSVKLMAEPYLIHDATAYMMYRSDTEFKKTVAYETSPQNTELYNIAREFEEKYKASKATHKTANQLLRGYLELKKWDKGTFLEKTQLDEINHSRLKNDDYKFSFMPLITMGFALGLDTYEMKEVLNAAGLSFNPTDEESQAYRFIFTAFPNRDIEECNNFLRMKGFKLLGSQSRYKRQNLKEDRKEEHTRG